MGNKVAEVKAELGYSEKVWMISDWNLKASEKKNGSTWRNESRRVEESTKTSA